MRRDEDDPFDDLEDLLEEFLSELADDTGVQSPGNDSDDSPTIHVDVREYDDAVKLVAHIPGYVDKNDLRVRCNGNTAVVGVEGVGERHVKMPVTVDAKSATANLNNGVLTTTFEKREESDDSVGIDLD